MRKLEQFIACMYYIHDLEGQGFFNETDLKFLYTSEVMFG